MDHILKPQQAKREVFLERDNNNLEVIEMGIPLEKSDDSCTLHAQVGR